MLGELLVRQMLWSWTCSCKYPFTHIPVRSPNKHIDLSSWTSVEWTLWSLIGAFSGVSRVFHVSLHKLSNMDIINPELVTDVGGL